MAQPDMSRSQPVRAFQPARVIGTFAAPTSMLPSSQVPPPMYASAGPAYFASSPHAPTQAYTEDDYSDKAYAPIVPKQRTFSRNRAGVLGFGMLILLMLVAIPIWDAALLLLDETFAFWIGSTLPLSIIICCLLLVFLYAITSVLFFRFGKSEYQTEQTTVAIASIFVTLLGFIMLLLAVPLLSQTSVMYTNLREHCDTNAATASLFEYYVVLHKIRQMPNCTAQYSVKSCRTEGYQDALPYTSFLEAIESDLKCSGFCYKKITGPVGSGNVTYPPTLFSNATYHNSCEGAMSRRLHLLGGDVAHTLFYLGQSLLGVAIGVGFLKLLDFCRSAPEGEREILVTKTMWPYPTTGQSYVGAAPAYASMPSNAATGRTYATNL